MLLNLKTEILSEDFHPSIRNLRLMLSVIKAIQRHLEKLAGKEKPERLPHHGENGTAAEALQQIDDKGYARPYEAEARTVCKVGVSFALEVESSMQESPTVSQPISGSWIFTSMRRLLLSTWPKRHVRDSE